MTMNYEKHSWTAANDGQRRFRCRKCHFISYDAHDYESCAGKMDTFPINLWSGYEEGFYAGRTGEHDPAAKDLTDKCPTIQAVCEAAFARWGKERISHFIYLYREPNEVAYG